MSVIIRVCLYFFLGEAKVVLLVFVSNLTCLFLFQTSLVFVPTFSSSSFGPKTNINRRGAVPSLSSVRQTNVSVGGYRHETKELLKMGSKLVVYLHETTPKKDSERGDSRHNRPCLRRSLPSPRNRKVFSPFLGYMNGEV